jgi:orotidine-5'-phosphate decarboxylase
MTDAVMCRQFDCKVGDIGNTMTAYATAFLREMRSMHYREPVDGQTFSALKPTTT